jgi:hypothetical protein
MEDTIWVHVVHLAWAAGQPAGRPSVPPNTTFHLAGIPWAAFLLMDDCLLFYFLLFQFPVVTRSLKILNGKFQK